jgi:hypothetical protein
MRHNNKTDIAIQGHKGKVSGAVVIHNAGIFVNKGSKTEMLAIDSFNVRDEGRLILAVLVIRDEARHEVIVLLSGIRLGMSHP